MSLIISNAIDNELHKYRMIVIYHYLSYLCYMIDLLINQYIFEIFTNIQELILRNLF